MKTFQEFIELAERYYEPDDHYHLERLLMERQFHQHIVNAER
jgi:hypothetical protein